MERIPLAGIRVVEAGDRFAVAACGSALAALGAKISVTREERDYRDLFPAAHADGKRFISDSASLHTLIAEADVVLTSSDRSTHPALARSAAQIQCDITAYGSSGPMAGVAHADALLQAVSGLADTTGEPDSAPTLCSFPVTEAIGALYASAGILTALLARTRTGAGQTIEIALFDCVFSTLSTFIPFHFVGNPVTRSGNRHVLASPWNIYRARDAWLVICTGSDEQWLRLCQVIGRPDLAADPRLRTAPDRVSQREVVDGAVQHWIEAHNAADAANALEALGVAAGPVVPVHDLACEANIRHRGLHSDRGFRSAIRHFPRTVPNGAADPSTRGATAPWYTDSTPNLPLAGLKVIELGQYTTAPFVARHLGALGAQVLKIEPPSGDATRAWPPKQQSHGYFFSLSNSDKCSYCLDLRTDPGRARFGELLATADVLVENLKPGSLEKFGFDQARRAAINPRLVYCAISGFGTDSAYPGRPAFDTVIQAMSGIMDSIRTGDRPQKAGISLADILGGLFSLIGTLSTLVDRERTGSGDALDISMQDAAAWITQWTRHAARQPRATILRCADGYVVALALKDCADASTFASSRPRTEVVEHFRLNGIEAAPVLGVREVARSGQAQARNSLVEVPDSENRVWTVFNTPLRLSRTPGQVRRAIGMLGEANTFSY